MGRRKRDEEKEESGNQGNFIALVRFRAVVSACKIQEWRNAESLIGEVARFFRYSAKRQRMLDKTVDLLCPEQRSKKTEGCM